MKSLVLASSLCFTKNGLAMAYPLPHEEQRRASCTLALPSPGRPTVVGEGHCFVTEVACVEVIQPRLTELSLSCVIDRAVADIASNVYPRTEPAPFTPPIIPAVS